MCSQPHFFAAGSTCTGPLAPSNISLHKLLRQEYKHLIPHICRKAFFPQFGMAKTPCSRSAAASSELQGVHITTIAGKDNRQLIAAQLFCACLQIWMLDHAMSRRSHTQRISTYPTKLLWDVYVAAHTQHLSLSRLLLDNTVRAGAPKALHIYGRACLLLSKLHSASVCV